MKIKFHLLIQLFHHTFCFTTENSTTLKRRNILTMKLGNELLPVYVNGRRCLILPGKKTNHVPLVLLGGTAQTIDSWNHHLMYLWVMWVIHKNWPTTQQLWISFQG